MYISFIVDCMCNCKIILIGKDLKDMVNIAVGTGFLHIPPGHDINKDFL